MTSPATSRTGGIVVGIDASRNRSGGAKGHLVGILSAGDPREHGISEVHVWSYADLLRSLPDEPWLVKHNPPALERSLLVQAWWQYRAMPKEVRREGCDILLSTDAGTVGYYRPSLVMSRDMLSYEPGEMQRYGISKARLRLLLLKYVQAWSMKRADGVIFLTQYASDTIQRVIGPVAGSRVIHHGVGEQFRLNLWGDRWPSSSEEPIRCLYVSNAAMYKHQWVVVRAVARLRRLGHNLFLTLAGGGAGPAMELLSEELARSDPRGEFTEVMEAVPHREIPALLSRAHLFLFASSCENMPNTLVEGMAAGLPIACSNRGPMPEVLGDGGVYFDPESDESIASAIGAIVVDPDLRRRVAASASERALAFSWSRCARETWIYLRDSAPV